MEGRDSNLKDGRLYPFPYNGRNGLSSHRHFEFHLTLHRHEPFDILLIVCTSQSHEGPSVRSANAT